MHARAIGVEDPRHLDAQLVLAVIVEEQRLGAALAFVVAGARADRIDVAPVVLGLRMDMGVAIDLAGRGLEDLRLHPLGQAQHVDGAMDAGLGRLHRIVLVVDRARRGRRGCRSRPPRHRAGRSRRGASARNAGCRADAATLSLVPVKKLSTQSTSCPSASSRSHRCEPRKPAPPVTRTRLRSIMGFTSSEVPSAKGGDPSPESAKGPRRAGRASFGRGAASLRGEFRDASLDASPGPRRAL